MKLADICERLGLEVKSGCDRLGSEVMGGYVSDLLSDVIANAREGDIWITLQGHENIVAVAALNNLAGIVIINGRKPFEETLIKAEEKNVPIMLSELSAFEIAGRLYELGLRGRE